jgi:hypothetical protein
MKKLLPLIFFFTLAVSFESQAQCAMCRRIAQTNYEQQDLISEQKEMKRGRSLNNGILYLLSVPYLIAGVGAFFWWKNRRR